MSKIRLHLKDPDGVYDSINNHVLSSLPTGLTSTEKEVVKELRQEEISNKISKWIRHGEYVTIEIDTDTGEAVVIPVK